MDGFLYKWTNYVSGWQRRYFTLQDGILSYFVNESDVDNGCKGALKVSACEIIVNHTDACRFEIRVAGDQRFFLKAANSIERQRWIIALCSCKAGITTMENVEKTQKVERLIESKRSELRINRDLLMQQINSACSILRSLTGKNQGLIEAVASLKVTSDTLLSNADELINLLLNFNRFKSVAAATPKIELSPTKAKRPFALPQSLLNEEQNIPKSASQCEISPRSTKIITDIVSTVASNRPPKNSLLNNHLRALRLTRLYPTFFSRMEFSFEDLALSQSATASTSICAVEFLACCRSALTFFSALATDNSTPSLPSTDLTQLGSLQTVYAEVFAYIRRLELAVKSLVNVEQGKETAINAAELTKQRSLTISLEDIVDADVQSDQFRVSGSAYFSLLWLARSLNFAAEFLNFLFKDTTATFQFNSASKGIVEDVARKAYNLTLRPFHDKFSIETAAVIMKSLPTAECIQHVLLCSSKMGNSKFTPPMEAIMQLQLDVERFVEAKRRCLLCVHRFLRQRHLDPVYPPLPET